MPVLMESESELQMTPKKPKPRGVVARGWTPWVYPTPEKYLMECCDCGLIHEMQFKAFREGRRLDDGSFLVIDAPAFRAAFRVRRALRARAKKGKKR